MICTDKSLLTVCQEVLCVAKEKTYYSKSLQALVFMELICCRLMYSSVLRRSKVVLNRVEQKSRSLASLSQKKMSCIILQDGLVTHNLVGSFRLTLLQIYC